MTLSPAPSLLDPQVLARLERLVALARRTPVARRRARPELGRGIEPGSRRPYAPGDDVRLVDWPAYARLDRLLVKVTEELPEPRLELVLDGSGSMAQGTPSPSTRAGLAASALAAVALARQVRVTLWWGGPGSPRVVLRRPGELVSLLRFLAARTCGGRSALEGLAGSLVELPGPPGGAVVLTDGLDPAATASAAARLRRRGFTALVVVAEAEAELPALAEAEALEAGTLELVDAETGERRRVECTPGLLQGARRARSDRHQELRRRLKASGVELELLTPAAPFESVALGLLRGR